MSLIVTLPRKYSTDIWRLFEKTMGERSCVAGKEKVLSKQRSKKKK